MYTQKTTPSPKSSHAFFIFFIRSPSASSSVSRWFSSWSPYLLPIPVPTIPYSSFLPPCCWHLFLPRFLPFYYLLAASTSHPSSPLVLDFLFLYIGKYPTLVACYSCQSVASDLAAPHNAQLFWSISRVTTQIQVYEYGKRKWIVNAILSYILSIVISDTDFLV